MRFVGFVCYCWLVVGLAMMLLQPSHAGIIVSFNALFLIIFSVLFFVKYVRTNPELLFLILSLNMFATYIISRLHYASDPLNIFLALAIICLLTYAYFWFRFRSPNVVLQIWLLVLLSTSTWCMLSSESGIYYFFHLNGFTHGSNREYHYSYWNNYSKLLFSEGQNKEALDANAKAIKAIMVYIKRQENSGVFDSLPYHHLDQLESNRIQIKDDSMEGLTYIPEP